MRNLAVIAACLSALLVSSAPILAAAPSDTSSPPSITVHFDDTAVRQLLTMIEKHDLDDSHLEAWLDLPANKHLLQVAASENNLTRAQLKANAIDVIKGTATLTTQPPDAMGCLRMDPASDYEAMLGGLEASENARIQQIEARDRAFAPAGTKIEETVYFHLGGDWDAVNFDGNVFVNIRFWHEGHAPGWDGLNMIVAHETMHTVQNLSYGNPQFQDTGTKAWLTALSKIQREGTARLVEYDTDPGSYREGTYGFYERAVDSETLRNYPRDLALLENLYKSCFPTFDHDRFTDEFMNGMNLGGTYYDIGYGIAKAIDDKLGRTALIATVSGGPKVFFGDYADLCKRNPDLPRLPDDVTQAVQTMPDKV